MKKIIIALCIAVVMTLISPTQSSAELLTEGPGVYPYFVDVIQIERVNGFRGFDFIITLEVYPTVGPHISVGKDQITFEVAPTIHNTVKLVKFNHLKSEKLPLNWQHIIKKT